MYRLNQQGKKQKKKKHFSLNNVEIGLTSWIFSTQEAALVEAEIRSSVAGSPRVHFQKGNTSQGTCLGEEQKANFRLLVAGFCRTFATLVSDYSKLPDKQNRKAALSEAWMKLPSNFRSGKSSPENILVIFLIIAYDSSLKGSCIGLFCRLEKGIILHS